MFNLSTLSGINLQTDNYFQYTSNASAFHLKRLYVLGKTHLRLKENVLAFCDERKDVFLCLFSGLEKPCFQTSRAPMMSRTELYP